MQQFVSSIFHYLAEVLEVIYHAKGTVFILQHLLLPCFIASGLWLSWENLKGTVFIWGKLLQPCSFKGAYLFHRTSFNNCCLHQSYFLMVNVLIWQFTAAIAELQLFIKHSKLLETFVLASMTFGRAAFSKEPLFRSV